MAIVIQSAEPSESELLAGIIRTSFHGVAEIFGLTMENCPPHPTFCSAEKIDRLFAKGATFFIFREHETPCACVAMEEAEGGLYLP